MTTYEKDLPHSADAEMNLLGMLDGSWGDVVGEAIFLEPRHFYIAWHRTIWQAAQSVHADGVEVNFLTLHDKLKEWDVIGEGKIVDSISDVTEYANTIPPNAAAKSLAESIHKTALRRWDIDRAGRLANAAYSGDNDDWQREREETSAYFADGAAGSVAGKAGGNSRRRSYPILTDLEVEAFEPAKGIVGDILFEDSIAYLFADSDTWKTFVAASWCGCVATGTPWLGREVQQGPAIFVPAEGARGFGKRLTAWKMRHDFAGQSIDFFVVPMAVNLLDRQSVPTLIDDIRAHPRLAGRKPAIIVFDTLASSMDGGDENDTPDANRVTSAVRSLKQAFGCCVLLLHHSGNAYTHRMRGNSAFRHNSDTTIQVIAPPLPEGQKRKPGDVVTLHSNKAKDDAGFDDIHLTTDLVEWTREDGAPVSSLVVVESDKTPAARGELVIMPQSSQDALKVLAAAGAPLTASQWERAYGQVRRTFYNARDDLEARQYVASDAPKGTKGAHYSVTEAGYKVLGAMVQGECKNGADAPLDLTEDGAEDGVAPIGTSEAAKPQFNGSQNGATKGVSIYPLAPLHHSSANGYVDAQAVRADVLGAAEAHGWRYIQVGPAARLGGTEARWRAFAANNPIEEVRKALDLLKHEGIPQ